MSLELIDILCQCLNSQRTARDLILKKVNLRGRQFSGLRADGLNLEEADLRESQLVNTKWKNCVLCDVRLDSAQLTKAVLRLCNLDRARATDAIFIQTHLENSTALGALFDRANFREARLTDTDFSRASFHGANLQGVSASGANFRGADLSEAKLRNADFSDTDLRGADLTGADLEGVILDRADLRGAIGVEAWQNASSPETLPEELKPLISTVAPMVEEMLRSAGKSGLIDPDTAEQLGQQMDALQPSQPSRSVHPHALEAVSEVIGSLGDETLPSLLGALTDPSEGDPPPQVQALIQRLGQAFSLGDRASAEEVLAQLVNTDKSGKTLDSN